MAGVQPIDQASILAGGRILVPNYLDEQIRRSLGQAQVDQAQVQTQALKQEMAANLLKANQRAQYDNDVRLALSSGDPRAISALIAKYPEQKDALKATYDQLDTLEQRSQLRQAAGIWSALNAGNVDSAIKQLEDRITADRQAGQDTKDDEDELALLKSGDPASINSVKGKLGLFMASVVPDKFASVIEQIGAGSDGNYTLSPGQKRFDAQGNVIAEAPFAPRPVTVGEGDTVVEYQPGDGGGVTVEQMIPITVTSESNGNPNAVSPKGARGTMQVMPSTQGRPGFGVAPLPADASPEAVAAQGADYLRAMMQRYGGDPAKAWAAYNAGPGAVDAALAQGGDWLARLPSETRAYVNKNMSALRQPSGARIIARGAPKPAKAQTRILTAQEVAAIPGLDPQAVYQQSPEGTITAVGGTTRSQLKPWPATALAARSSNNAALTNIEGAINLIDPKNQSKEAKTARAAIGFGTGMLGDRFTQWNDPEGTDARARIGQIGGLIIKDTSGAAVSLAEDARLAKWVPLVTDSPKVAYAKLQNLKREISQRNQAMDDTYSEDQGFRPFKAASTPVRVRSIQEANALAPGTIYIAPDGKTRRR